jgi:hypothetical protein
MWGKVARSSSAVRSSWLVGFGKQSEGRRGLRIDRSGPQEGSRGPLRQRRMWTRNRFPVRFGGTRVKPGVRRCHGFAEVEEWSGENLKQANRLSRFRCRVRRAIAITPAIQAPMGARTRVRKATHTCGTENRGTTPCKGRAHATKPSRDRRRWGIRGITPCSPNPRNNPMQRRSPGQCLEPNGPAGRAAKALEIGARAADSRPFPRYFTVLRGR